MKVKPGQRAIDITGLAPGQLKHTKDVKPAQEKLDRANRKITVIAFESNRKPAIFQCDVCDHIWTVQQARYVIQQNRGCKVCASKRMSESAKRRHEANTKINEQT